jgi:hypothetical protein
MAIDYLRHPQKLAEQREKLNRLVKKLDNPGASMNVARLALSMINGNPHPDPLPAYRERG